MNKSIFLVLLFTLAIINYSFAFEYPKSEKKPKVGLVLSGGGAKGIAHIGVLKVLEEVGIKPDYITGTSMGSIMGGLYSIGYTASELDSIVKHIDWTQMLSDRIPLSMVVPVEKHDYNRFLLSFPIEKSGPRLPDGLISGQGIAEEMNHLTWRVAHLDSFDDYPIPFRCVASDLISGQAYIFDSGKLSTAMRASMAIPSVFSPVRMDTMLLVDGGVLDNIPVSTCKDMGADIIITVNVGFEDKPSLNDFQTIADVLMGSAMIRSNYEAEKSLEQTDILITPIMGEYSAGSFTAGPEIIEIGEVAARKNIKELEELANYLNQYEEEDERVKLEPVEEVYLSQIAIDSLHILDKKFIIGKFGLDAGKSYSKADINGGLHRLIGTRYIDHADYTLTPQDSGYSLTLEAKESYKSKMSIGIHYDNTHKAGATVNASFRNWLLKGSHLKLTVDISEFPRLATDYYDYIGVKQKVGLYARIRLNSNRMPVYYESGSEVGHFVQSYFDTDVGFFMSPGSKGILSVGAFYRMSLINLDRGFLDLIANDVDRFGNNWWGLRFNYNKNSLDKQFFPNKGSLLDVRVDMPIHYGEIYKGPDSTYIDLEDLITVPNQHYIKALLKYRRYLDLSKNFNLKVGGTAGWLSATSPFADLFYVGGISSIARTNDVSFYGLMPREVMSSQFAMVNADFRYTIFSGLNIHVIGNVMNAMDEGSFNVSNLYPETVEQLTIWGGGIMLSYESILGPIEVGYGRSTLHDSNRWYVTAGFPF